jgi:hypothetical protein
MLMSTPFISKSSKVAKVTVAGGGQPLYSDLDSHMLSHMEYCSIGEVLAAAIILSLDDDDAASLYFACRCIFRLGDGIFLLIPNKICFISASSVRNQSYLVAFLSFGLLVWK